MSTTPKEQENSPLIITIKRLACALQAYRQTEEARQQIHYQRTQKTRGMPLSRDTTPLFSRGIYLYFQRRLKNE